MTRESFVESVAVLWQYKEGYNNCMERDSYYDGFFTAFNIWLSAAYEHSYYVGDADFDATGGFRRVVNAHQNGICNSEDEDFGRGYEDAVRAFRAAKGL